ncbi:MAG: aminotransferase class V-fold PLP-dependent enzyme [Clostridia bacterium]|nr:aminotransferase class V-fold PLP-dependent enzyme [Clostridia bacterium]
MSLHDDINLYLERDLYPFHMPGHKRNPAFDSMNGLFARDLTEVDGVDDLHCPQGIILEAQKRAAKLYDADDAYFLVNGSTAGLLTAISASAELGSKVIAARNCHKAVYNAIFLRNLTPVYVYPAFDEDFGINGSVFPEEIEKAIAANPDASAVILTSPTYDGVVSDIKTIAEIVHRNNMLLIVDAAHGAHHGMHPAFPDSAVHLGADAVIVSLHKTLPSPTGTAMLLCNGERINRSRVRRFLDVYETSSPSYLFMSAMDACIGLLAKQKETLFSALQEKLVQFSEAVRNLQAVRVFCIGNDRVENHPSVFAHDMSRIVVKAEKLPMNGFALEDVLRNRFGIEAEMSFADCTVLLTSICDTQEGFDRLVKALLTLDAENRDNIAVKRSIHAPPVPQQVFTPAQAEMRDGCMISLNDAENCICREYVCAYPPGTPLLVPGERITAVCLSYINAVLQCGAKVTGSSGKMPAYIDVCAE